MTIKLAEVEVKKSSDYRNEVIQALVKAGFIIVLDHDGITEKRYIIAKESDAE